MDKKHHGKTPDIVEMNENDFPILQSILHMGPSKSDPDGMYTGRPMNIHETPVQDSDDL